jgi:hypothetical protein
MAGKTAEFYHNNKESRDKKKKYDSKYHSSEERKDYRVGLNRERRKRNLQGDSRDLSHTKKGGLVLENKSTNRARQGSGKNKRLK